MNNVEVFFSQTENLKGGKSEFAEQSPAEEKGPNKEVMQERSEESQRLGLEAG